MEESNLGSEKVLEQWRCGALRKRLEREQEKSKTQEREEEHSVMMEEESLNL